MKNQVLKFNEEIKKLSSNLKTEKDQQELFSFLKYGSQALIKLNKEEFKILLEEKKIKNKIDHLSEIAQIMNEELSAYTIDSETGTLTLKLKDSENLSEPVFDLGNFLETRLNIKKNDLYFNLFLGFFSIKKNYELAQFYQTALKLGEE